jgi:hypothetical protein
MPYISVVVMTGNISVTGERPHRLSENYLKGRTLLDVDILERLGLAAIGEVVVFGERPGSVCVCVCVGVAVAAAEGLCNA